MGGSRGEIGDNSYLHHGTIMADVGPEALAVVRPPDGGLLVLGHRKEEVTVAVKAAYE